MVENISFMLLNLLTPPIFVITGKGGVKMLVKEMFTVSFVFLKNFDFLLPSSSEVDLNVKITFF